MLELFGSWSPPQARGIMELSVTSTCTVAGVELSKEVRSRRLFKMTMAACPEVLAGSMGMAFGSLVHVNPVELGRAVRSTRRQARRPEPAEVP